ncbi:TetR/AcrR family transcriptional regulator [Ramlibacter rhizophilus]|uniref:TetR/AcrR family transcriptional regulator n=1 Tax=Ramlibacter rhizophilus TaxID=1781167 RepID=A0A4Z0C2L3_9BURK|nr:TetR/AcrR family transcriptional regulator [Ramlibacter rhizophilus]TFZ04455.1 TetR/AcrR family transcriptional regulator [Ramlibacter rhizophilus]
MSPSVFPGGEERVRDADRSQASILAAARDEFAEFGLGGARMERIAERCGLNKRLIYYYFQDKDALFGAVLEHAYREIRSAEQALNLLELPPEQALRRLVEFTWEYYLAHPEFLTLLNSANLHKGRHLSGSERAREVNTPLVDTLGQILERGRGAGVFRGGVDPVQLYVSIAGMAYFYLSNNYTLSAIFGRDLRSRKALSERLGHMTEVILGYVLRN